MMNASPMNVKDLFQNYTSVLKFNLAFPYFTRRAHNHILHFKKHVLQMRMNGTYSGSSVALPTVRAENF